MRAALELLRGDSALRRFFAAHLQSSLGTGAGYVALVLVAYHRFRSPWAITLVLLADLIPSMLLGPLLGAAVDRWSRRACAVAADLARAGAFVGLGLVDSFEATVALALVAGTGAGVFGPAVLSAVPRMAGEARTPAATSLWRAVNDLGHTLGPAVAALAFLVVSPEVALIVNGATFAVSAAILASLPLGGQAGAGSERAARRPSLLQEAREGLRATAAMSGVRPLLAASSGVVLFAGMLNVGELLLAAELGAGASGFSMLVAVFGLGVVAGSLTGSRGGEPDELRRRYLLGVIAVAAGLGAAGLAPAYPIALVAFGLAGLGNGLVVVHQRLIFQRTVPDRFLGRVFGLEDALSSWAFAVAFGCAGAVAALAGARPLFLVAAGGTVAVWVLARGALTRALREPWSAPPAAAPAPGPAVAPAAAEALPPAAAESLPRGLELRR